MCTNTPGILRPPRPFDAILETHNLVALNTWGDPEKSRTFYSDIAESQIDFVTRRKAADPRSRTLWPDPKIKLFEWREGGKHLCLQGSIPCKVYQPPPPAKHSYARQDLLHAAQHKLPAFQSFEHAVTESLSTQNPSPEAMTCCQCVAKNSFRLSKTTDVSRGK